MILTMWPRLRRAAVSMMLAALASFVLDGAVMAAHHAAKAESTAQCLKHAVASAGGHDHAVSTVHQGHAYQGYGNSGPANGDSIISLALDHQNCEPGSDENRAKAPCCGSLCSMALIAADAPFATVLARDSEIVVSDTDFIEGLDRHGLQRPPRTPGIA